MINTAVIYGDNNAKIGVYRKMTSRPIQRMYGSPQSTGRRRRPYDAIHSLQARCPFRIYIIFIYIRPGRLHYYYISRVRTSTRSTV